MNILVQPFLNSFQIINLGQFLWNGIADSKGLHTNEKVALLPFRKLHWFAFH